MKRDPEIFQRMIEIMYGGEVEKVTLTKDNAPDCEGFLNFRTYPEIVISFENGMVNFDCDEPLRLEDCPNCLLEAVVENAN